MVAKEGMLMLTQQPRRLGLAEAKSKLSEVLRDAAQGPVVIHSRGRDLAVVLAVADYERLIVHQQPVRIGGEEFLRRVEELKKRHGGGVDFEPAGLEDRDIEIAVSEAADSAEEDTAYLLRSPANRDRLLKAIENVSQGRNLEVVDLGDLG